MPNNLGLRKADGAEKDEFYTQFDVIEDEMKHYKEYFKGKVVFCNCDDPKQSQFWQYFIFNFKDLGLKRLVSTHYKPSVLFEVSDAYKLEYDGKKKKKTLLKGDGDFRSDECIELLKSADIVVTNPPFSLFREYVAHLVKYKKKFLIIGNVNSASYQSIFPLIQNNKLWFGCSIKSGDREFRVPNDYPLRAASCREDEEGHRYIRVKGVRWLTNIPHKDRNMPLPLWKHYTPEEYPKYDNYNAIEVGKTKYIPIAYDGEMGVPITFLDKYSPKQFEILGLATSPFLGEFKLEGKTKYVRIVIKHKKGKK